MTLLKSDKANFMSEIGRAFRALKMSFASARYLFCGSIYRCCKCLKIHSVSGRMFDEWRTGNNSKNSYSRI